MRRHRPSILDTMGGFLQVASTLAKGGAIDAIADRPSAVLGPLKR
jgi:hypothetical protein